MPSDDRAGCIDKNGIEESKTFDRSSDLLDLALGMGARVVLVRSKRLEISKFRSGQRNRGVDLLLLCDPHGDLLS